MRNVEFQYYLGTAFQIIRVIASENYFNQNTQWLKKVGERQRLSGAHPYSLLQSISEEVLRKSL